MTLQITIIIILVLSLIFVISVYDITTKTLKQKNKQLFDSLMSTQSGFQADLKKSKDDYNTAAAEATKFEGWYHAANKRAVWGEQGVNILAELAAEIQAGKRYKKSDPKYPAAVEALKKKHLNIAYGIKSKD
jgi:hypothetical protein